MGKKEWSALLVAVEAGSRDIIWKLLHHEEIELMANDQGLKALNKLTLTRERDIDIILFLESRLKMQKEAHFISEDIGVMWEL